MFMFGSRRIVAHVRVSEPSSYDERKNGGMSYSPAGGHRSAPQSFQLCGGKKEESQTLTTAMMQSPEDTKSLIWILKKT